MYCGCNGIAQSSQTRIAGAMLALLERKPFSALTVSELCREAGVSRPTYYSLFDSMEEVIRYILQDSCCYSPEADRTKACTLESFCLGYSLYISANRDFLSLLMRNGLFHILYRSIEESLTECGCFLADADPATRRYAARFTAGGLAGFIQNYTEDEPCSVQCMSGILAKLLSGEYSSRLLVW